jgi:starvation-inducible DNA-binding protein
MINPNPQKPAAQAKVIAALLPCLADMLDLAGNAKLAHWHVRGPQFIALHELFGTFSATLHAQVDRIAERVTLAMGGAVLGTARQVAEESRLDDFPADERGADALCKALVDGARDLSDGLGEACDACMAAGDEVTANLLQDIAATVEQGAGLIAAHLG